MFAEKQVMVKIAFTLLKEGESTKERLKKAEFFIKKSKKLKAEIVCFGETFPISTNDSNAQKRAVRVLAILSKNHKMAIIAGAGNKKSNKALYFANGRLIGEQLKGHFFANEVRDEKADDFRVFRFKKWKIGILVCYDLFFPETARYLQQKGADAIFCLSHAFKGQKFWEPLALVRSMENQVPIVLSGTIQPEYHITGPAVLALPNNTIYTIEKEGLKVVDVDLKKWKKFRKAKSNSNIKIGEYIQKGVQGPFMGDENKQFLKKYVKQVQKQTKIK
ncbi:MAG: carbon-nitrogen hydrolase family protein [Candidatus Diapherotrites archaeon]